MIIAVVTLVLAALMAGALGGYAVGRRRPHADDYSDIPIPEGFQRWGGFPCPVFDDEEIDVVFHNRPKEIRRIRNRTAPSGGGVSDGCWWWHPQYAKIIGIRYLPDHQEKAEARISKILAEYRRG